jgi:adenylate cyclase
LQSESSPQSPPFPIEELPFTDRTIEIQKLQTSIQWIKESGQGGLVLVSGEAGIGKTRLCQEIKKFAQSKDFRWLSAKCTRGEDLAPYTPWIQLLREFATQASIQLFYKVSGPYLNEIVKLIPELAESSGIASSMQTTSPGASAEETMQKRLQFFQSLTQFFVRLSRESPLVLFFDDLQWADPAAIQLLKFFRANALNNASLLILVSYRDFEVEAGENPSVASFLKDLEYDRKYTRIHLERFDDANVGDLLGAISGNQKISNEFKELIYSKTGGNPFFIEEVLRSLVERGDVFRNEKGLWDRKPISEIDIPLSIQGLIRQRIDRLDQETREVLKIASVIGEVFEFHILSKVAHEIVDQSHLVRAVAIAQAAVLIRKKKVRPTQGGEGEKEVFIFSDESMHDVLYEELDPPTAKSLHDKVANVLEETYGNSTDDEFAPELSFHFMKAGDLQKALEYSTKAGDRAARLYSHEQAARYYANALDLIKERKNDELKARLLRLYGEEVWLLGQYQISLEYWTKAARVYEELKDYRTAGDLYRALSFLLVAYYDRNRSLAFQKEALRLLEQVPRSEELAHAYLYGSMLLAWDNQGEMGRELYSKGATLTTEIDAGPRIRSISSQMSFYNLDISDKAQALEEAERSVKIALDHGLIREAGFAFCIRGMAHSVIKGASSEALANFEEGIQYTTRVGHDAALTALKFMLAIQDYVPLGQWKKAEEIAQAFKIASEGGASLLYLKGYSLPILGQTFLYRGDLDEAEQCLKAAVGISRGFGFSELALVPYLSLGRLHIFRGDLVQARKFLAQGHDISKGRGLVAFNAIYHIQLLSLLAESEIKDSESEKETTSKYVVELENSVRRTDEPWAYAYLTRVQAMVFESKGDIDEAIESYRKSIGYFRKLKWPYELAATLYLLAKVFTNNDLENGTNELDEAIQIFSGLGAKRDEQVCLSLQKEREEMIEQYETPPKSERGLAAIMFTDIVGYTALTQANEAEALEVLKRHNRLLRPFFPRYHGREVKTMGDSFLIEFSSALDATNCAIEIQKFLHDYNISTKEDWKIKLRIGIHLGDVIHKERDILGDAVNIASRIQPLAEPESICLSQQVFDQIHNKIAYPLQQLEKSELRNVKFSTNVYAILMPWEKVTKQSHLVEKPSTEVNRLRIAVLPFSSMSPDPNDEYFADGMTEELISTMSKISGLQVIARTSVLRYKGGNKAIDEIGRELKAGTILEGSVRKAGNKLRITAQLINSLDSGHLWSETYDRELKDIFEIQSDISRTVANALRIKLGAREEASIVKVPTGDMEAYNLFLRGMYVVFHGFLKDDILKAISYFEKAIALDQSFAIAYSWLAECYLWLGDTDYLSLGERSANRSKAHMAVSKALQLDPELADAHLVLASLKQAQFDWTSAEGEIRKALGLNLNVPAGHEAYAWLLADLGRVEEAAAEAKKGLELNPLDFGANRTSVLISYLNKDYDKAIEQERKMAELYTGNLSVRIATDLGLIYLSKSDFNNAIEEFHKAIELDRGEQKYDESLAGLAFAYAKLGRREEARKILDDLKGMSNTRFVPYRSIAQIHLALGEKDEAIKVLERAYNEKDDLSLGNLRFLPLYDELRSDLRFIELIEKIGLMSPEEAMQAKREKQRNQTLHLAFDKKRIAILPFANFSPDPSDEYFSDGMTEELISTMSKIGGLKVIARTSTMGYKREHQKKIDEIARELKVGTILEGSVRKANDKLRITVQLIDSDTSEHLWSDSYDRELKDIFAIQSDISETVADALKIRLLPREKAIIEKQPTKNTEAYTVCLKGIYHNVNASSENDLRRSLRYFEKAIDLDPNFALAYSWLSDCYTTLVQAGFLAPKETIPKAERAVRKALEIDPDLADAHRVLGFLLIMGSNLDWIGAERETKKALELNANVAIGHESYAWILAFLGRLDEALAEAEKAIELDPLSGPTYKTMARVLYFSKQYDRAIEQMKKMQELSPEDRGIAIELGICYLEKGQFDKAISEFNSTLEPSRGKSDLALYYLALAYAKSGRTEKAKKILNDFKEISSRNQFIPAFVIAQIHVVLGEGDEAIWLLEKACDERENASLLDLKVSPIWDGIRSDQRFVSLLKKVGLENQVN